MSVFYQTFCAVGWKPPLEHKDLCFLYSTFIHIFKNELCTKVGSDSIVEDPFAVLMSPPLGSGWIKGSEQGKASKLCRKKAAPVRLVLIHTAHA